MLKKIISLALATVVASSLFVMPAQAASFSEDNVKRNYYNLSKAQDGTVLVDSEWAEVAVPAASHVNAGEGTRDSHVKMTWEQAKNDSEQQAVKYYRNNSTAGYVDGTEAPRYVHQRVQFVWYDGTIKNNNRLRFALSYGTDGQRAKIFEVSGKDHSDVYFQDWGTASTNRRLVYNAGTPIKVTGAGEEEKINTMDLIVNVNDNESNHKGMVYVFFNGELCVYGKPASNAPDVFYGWSITSYGGDVGDYLRMWQVEDRIGHTEYYDANGYVPTFEDVLNNAGLTDAVEDSTVMMKTSNMRWFMPHGQDKVRIDSAVSASSETNWLNNDGSMNTVVYNGTQATVSRTLSDAEGWNKAANLLAGVYPQKAHGIAYSSYHPRAKFIRFSFDQTMGEDVQLAYRLNDNEAATAVKFRDNNGKLVVDLGDVAQTSDANTFEKNRIDWVIEPDEGADGGVTTDDTLTHYIFVNEKLVATGTSAPGTQNVRISDIVLYTKGSTTPSVVYDNWSMTLYNDTQTIDALTEAITGVAPAPSVNWMDEECGIEYDEESGDFIVYAGATAKNYDAPSKIIVAVYGTSGKLLEVDLKDFESEVVIGNEVEPTVFNANSYDEEIANISVFVWEMDGIVPALDKKDIAFN